MSRILRRPMFRGGRVSSYGTGIASGLADGGRVGYADGDIVDIYESVKERIPERERQGLTRGDYLRIASAGLDILGAPGETGGILGGTLSAASKPLSKLGIYVSIIYICLILEILRFKEKICSVLNILDLNICIAKSVFTFMRS